MPRTARFEELGLPFHVIVQGHGRRAIVRDDVDRLALISRAVRVFRESSVETLAWSLLDNHVHFALRASEGPLGKPMQRILGPYARGFNLRHGLVGRLTRDRFFSRPVEDDDDLSWLVGYILLNPIRAGIVRDMYELRNYRWSSLTELCYPERVGAVLVTEDAVLSLFGSDRLAAVDALLTSLRTQFLDDPNGLRLLPFEPLGGAGLSTRQRFDLESISTHALLLRSDRIDAVLRRNETITAIRLRLEKRGWDVARVIVRAAELASARTTSVRRGSRRRPASKARALAAHFAHAYLGLTDADVARAVGVSRQSMGVIRRRGQQLVEQEKLTWQAFFQVADAPQNAR